MRRRPRSLALIVCLGLADPGTTERPQPAPEIRSFMRGMVVSCPRWGAIWGEPAMADAVAELARLGVGWVAIHPYAGVRRDGSIRPWTGEDWAYLERAAAIVDEAGLDLFWKPHLAYWGSFDWRGDITFEDERDWARFFGGYGDFIERQALLAARLGADLFAVGVELDRTVTRPEWPDLIERVRRAGSPPLTYAANWDSVSAVPFWRELDYIGVHAYYPLSAAEDPDAALLAAGWQRPLADLEALSDATGRRVVFAEIGYNRSSTAASAPWEYRDDPADAAVRLRRRLIDTALREVEAAPHVAGMFWWKWMPGSRSGRDFSMKTDSARGALRRAWIGGPVTPTADGRDTPGPDTARSAGES